MKKELLFDIIGDLDENIVKSAEDPPDKNSLIKWLVSGLVAVACIGVVVGIGFWYNKSQNLITNDTGENDESEADIAIEYSDVNIYYVNNNGIQSISVYTACDPKDIFEYWKSYNGIDDDVQLIKTSIEDNGVEIVDSFSAQYIVGDKFILNVTVSKDLEKYYETIPEEQLLKSLELTLTSYQQIEFDEYNLILE